MIYLDNNATTKVDDAVINAMLPYFTEYYGNPSSSHLFGVKVNNELKRSRQIISSILNCNPYEIIFTSGATESINLGIKGIVESQSYKGNHIITLKSEHSAVLDTCRYLETKGFEVSYLDVNKDGLVDLNSYKNSFKSTTILTIVMFVNNEIGVIQPIKELCEIAHFHKSLFLTDATQAVGKLKIDINELNVDLLAFSGHKFHAPKGIGILYIKRNNKIKITSQIHGGHQEMNIRSGTVNIPSIIGITKAMEIINNSFEKDVSKVKCLRDLLEYNLLKFPKTTVNGNTSERSCNVSNILFHGIDSDAVITGLNNISISKGSACSSMSTMPSHVLKSLGLSDNDCYSSLRFSLCKYNNLEEIEYVTEALISILKKIADLNN